MLNTVTFFDVLISMTSFSPAEEKKKQKEEAEANQKEVANVELEKVNDDICEAKSGISVANDLILQAQVDLEKAQERSDRGKNIQWELIKTATSKLKVGNERKRKFEGDLSKLEKKKRRMRGSK